MSKPKPKLVLQREQESPIVFVFWKFRREFRRKLHIIQLNLKKMINGRILLVVQTMRIAILIVCVMTVQDTDLTDTNSRNRNFTPSERSGNASNGTSGTSSISSLITYPAVLNAAILIVNDSVV